MPELIIGSFATKSEIATVRDKQYQARWGKAKDLHNNNTLQYTKHLNTVNINENLRYGQTAKIDLTTRTTKNTFTTLSTTKSTRLLEISVIDSHFSCVIPNDFNKLSKVSAASYINILPFIDVDISQHYYSVRKLDEKPRKPEDNRYLPTSDFNITGELASFTANFSKPIDFDKLVTPLSPVGFLTKVPWHGTGELVRFSKRINYGYSINKFFVGGGPRVIYPVDEDAIDPPDDNAPIKVIKIVNNVSVVTLPARTPLSFDNIQLARQIDSFAWSATINLLDQTSFDLVRPTVNNTVEIEISINGTVWNMFVSKGSKSQQFNDSTFQVTALSKSALLQDIYAGKTSYTNNSNATPASLINDLVTSYGFTSIWDLTPSWTINQHQFSVQNKSPIEAVSTIASSIGAVIEPDLVNKTITIKPWCETNPWQWNALTGLPSMDANLSYQVSEDYAPQAQANAIYVSGQENGVAAKCVISGTAGNVLLPSVSDKLITDTAAAQERGRIELAKSGHKENVPITSYIDENETLLMPGNMITINNTETNPWNGMVVETSITVANEGLEVYQTLSVLRHYD